MGAGGRTSARQRSELRPLTVRGERGRGRRLFTAFALVGAALFGAGAEVALTDQGREEQPAAAPTDPFPLGTLPPGSARIGRAGFFYSDPDAAGSIGGVLETDRVGS